jgi:hypothetical protein
VRIPVCLSQEIFRQLVLFAIENRQDGVARLFNLHAQARSSVYGVLLDPYPNNVKWVLFFPSETSFKNLSSTRGSLLIALPSAAVDLVPVYPAVLVPKFSANLRTWYINKYRDQFFIDPPNWFHVYVALEAVYHLPLSIWAVGALLRDDAMVPLHLLVWSIETAVTTLTCVVEAMSWPGYSRREQSALLQLYLPYLLLGKSKLV